MSHPRLSDRLLPVSVMAFTLLIAATGCGLFEQTINVTDHDPVPDEIVDAADNTEPPPIAERDGVAAGQHSPLVPEVEATIEHTQTRTNPYAEPEQVALAATDRFLTPDGYTEPAVRVATASASHLFTEELLEAAESDWTSTATTTHSAFYDTHDLAAAPDTGRVISALETEDTSRVQIEATWDNHDITCGTETQHSLTFTVDTNPNDDGTYSISNYSHTQDCHCTQCAA